MGGNQRPLFSIREGWPEFNPPLSFPQEPLTDWKLAVSQCPISLLVYPLNCADGWKDGSASYRDLQGRSWTGPRGPSFPYTPAGGLLSGRPRRVGNCPLTAREL